MERTYTQEEIEEIRREIRREQERVQRLQEQLEQLLQQEQGPQVQQQVQEIQQQLGKRKREFDGNGGARSRSRAPYTHRSVQTHGPTRRVRHVRIRGHRGTKSQSVYHRGRHLYTVKKTLRPDECHRIRHGHFVPGLFRDCKKQNGHSRRRSRRSRSRRRQHR